MFSGVLSQSVRNVEEGHALVPSLGRPTIVVGGEIQTTHRHETPVRFFFL